MSRVVMLVAAVLLLAVGIVLVTSSGSLAGVIAWGLALVVCFVVFQVSVTFRKHAAARLAEAGGVALPSADGQQSKSSTFAVAFGFAAAGVFLAFDDLVSAGGSSCEVYCGPGSILLPCAVGLLAFAFWLVAITLVVVTIRTNRTMVLRVAAVSSVLALPIAVVSVWLGR
ncbi:MAG TPA: hypothetical protein VL294_03290 [Pseudolysinimonas sp.]|nr:hypothetical protein [Pseudolysinimonas sp.]